MDEHKLPKYHANKQTGNIAADILKATLQRFAIINSHDESIDLGIDMRGQVIENAVPKNQFFNIQCKGTTKLNTKSAESYFDMQLSVTTINYWYQQNDTTFLFLVDLVTENCYWCNPVIDLSDRIDAIQTQDTVIIKVPRVNMINKQTTTLPKKFINAIILYAIKNLNVATLIVKKVGSDLQRGEVLDLDFSIQLLQDIVISVEEINAHSNLIIEYLIKEIKQSWIETQEYIIRLIYSHPAKRYVSDYQTDTGFLNSNRCYDDLNKEIDGIILDFESKKITVLRLNDLKDSYKELLDYQINLLAFLREMSYEDNPFGDYTESNLELDKLMHKRSKI